MITQKIFFFAKCYRQLCDEGGRVAYIHKWVPIDKAGLLLVKLDVAVLDAHAEPLNVATIRLLCFLVFVFLADQRKGFAFATTARCVHDYVLNLELVDVG